MIGSSTFAPDHGLSHGDAAAAIAASMRVISIHPAATKNLIHRFTLLPLLSVFSLSPTLCLASEKVYQRNTIALANDCLAKAKAMFGELSSNTTLSSLG